MWSSILYKNDLQLAIAIYFVCKNIIIYIPTMLTENWPNWTSSKATTINNNKNKYNLDLAAKLTVWKLAG